MGHVGGLDYEGLTRVDEELRIVPGAAESWAFSDDGMTLTFHLREGLVYSDGVPVTAEHFRLRRGADLQTRSLNSRSADLALRRHRLRGALFHLGRPVRRRKPPQTPGRGLSSGCAPWTSARWRYRFEATRAVFPRAGVDLAVPSHCAGAGRGGRPRSGGPIPGRAIGNGPFRLVELRREGPEPRVRYARNERYWAGPAPSWTGSSSSSSMQDPAMEAYHNGRGGRRLAGRENLPAIEADPILSRELVIIPEAGTGYFNFNLHREPFQDPKVREAFAYAFDREAYCRQVDVQRLLPLTLSMIPPGIPGAHRDRCLCLRSGKGAAGAGGVLVWRPGEPAGGHLVRGGRTIRVSDRGAVVLRAVPPGARRRADHRSRLGGGDSKPACSSPGETLPQFAGRGTGSAST